MQIDIFESQFKSAYKDPYVYEEIKISKIALICRQDRSRAEKVKESVSGLLPEYSESLSWTLIPESEFTSVKEALEHIEHARPDLIIIERNIKVTEESLVYGLSPYVETISQVTTTPLLLLPNADLESAHVTTNSSGRVMIETNRLTGDSTIINWGVFFSKPNGQLFLNHIEDQTVFKKYISAIEKVSEINSEIAEKALHEELLKLPNDFIRTVTKTLATQAANISVSGLVRFGHSIKDFRDDISQHEVDILIINSKDEAHLAMESMAYECAIEFKEKPMLLL